MHSPLSAQLQRIVMPLAIVASQRDGVELWVWQPRRCERDGTGLRLIDVEAIVEAGAASSDVRSAHPDGAPFTFDAEVELSDHAVIRLERDAGNTLARHSRRRQTRREWVWERR